MTRPKPQLTQQQITETKVLITMACLLLCAREAMAPRPFLQTLAEAMADPKTRTRAICMEKASRPQKPLSLPQAFSIDIPQELTSEMRLFKDDKKALYRIGELWCINQCKDLIKKGVPAVHFYTMGKAANVVNILRECF